MSKEQTIAICFCGAAKTQSLGIPLIAAMWTHSDPLTMAYIQVPVVLYTMEQVFLAQGLVYFFKWYLRRDQKQPDVEVAETVTSDDASQERVGGDAPAGQSEKEAPVFETNCKSRGRELP
jgi:solute carrier family 10 (sodium/bile acid cotransporter), member 7